MLLLYAVKKVWFQSPEDDEVKTSKHVGAMYKIVVYITEWRVCWCCMSFALRTNLRNTI